MYVLSCSLTPFIFINGAAFSHARIVPEITRMRKHSLSVSYTYNLSLFLRVRFFFHNAFIDISLYSEVFVKLTLQNLKPFISVFSEGNVSILTETNLLIAFHSTKRDECRCFGHISNRCIEIISLTVHQLFEDAYI